MILVLFCKKRFENYNLEFKNVRLGCMIVFLKFTMILNFVFIFACKNRKVNRRATSSMLMGRSGRNFVDFSNYCNFYEPVNFSLCY